MTRARHLRARGRGVSCRDRVRCAPHQQLSPKAQPFGDSLEVVNETASASTESWQQNATRTVSRRCGARRSVDRAGGGRRLEHGTAGRPASATRAARAAGPFAEGGERHRESGPCKTCDCRLPASEEQGDVDVTSKKISRLHHTRCNQAGDECAARTASARGQRQYGRLERGHRPRGQWRRGHPMLALHVRARLSARPLRAAPHARAAARTQTPPSCSWAPKASAPR
eukprot:1731707-Prymnesium_polylepis.2